MMVAMKAAYIGASALPARSATAIFATRYPMRPARCWCGWRRSRSTRWTPSCAPAP